MSIYCSFFEVNGMHYHGSHVVPLRNHKKGGEVGISAIPHHVVSRIRDDLYLPWHPFLRIHFDGVKGDTLILSKSQVRKLRDALSEWIENAGNL